MSAVKAAGLASLLVLLVVACSVPPTPAAITLHRARLRETIFHIQGDDRVAYSPAQGSNLLLVADVTVSVRNDGVATVTARIPGSAFAIVYADGQRLAAEGMLDAQGQGLVNGNLIFDLPVGAGETASADYQVIFLFPKQAASDSLRLQYAEGDPVPFTLTRAFTAETPPVIVTPYCDAQLATGAISDSTYLCIEGTDAPRLAGGRNWLAQAPSDVFATGCSYWNGLCLITEQWALAFVPAQERAAVSAGSAVAIMEPPTPLPEQTVLSGGVVGFETIRNHDATAFALAARFGDSWAECEGPGQLELRELEYDPLTGQVVRIAAAFDLTCSANAEGLRGAVRWQQPQDGPVAYDGPTLPW